MNFLVIEGLDGAGKSTQVKKIGEYLEKQRIKFEYLHFPQVEKGIFGDLVAKFLRGELGNNDSVNPYLIALIYAGDRKDASDMINDWIDKGAFVLVDRYVYSNIAFQCAKLSNWEERERLRNWILNLEFGYNKIPKPAHSLFLDVPFSFTERSLNKNRTGDDRNYLKGQKDIHESDLSFQKTVRDIYHWQIEKSDDFSMIECGNNDGSMKTPEEIFELIQGKIDYIIKK